MAGWWKKVSTVDQGYTPLPTTRASPSVCRVTQLHEQPQREANPPKPTLILRRGSPVDVHLDGWGGSHLHYTSQNRHVLQIPFTCFTQGMLCASDLGTPGEQRRCEYCRRYFEIHMPHVSLTLSRAFRTRWHCLHVSKLIFQVHPVRVGARDGAHVLYRWGSCSELHGLVRGSPSHPSHIHYIGA